MSLPPSIHKALDDFLVDHAAEVVAHIAKSKRISPQYLALEVPGVCHTHVPSKKRKQDCAFCTRRGNCFEDAAEAGAAADAADATDATDDGKGKVEDLVTKHLDVLVEHFLVQLKLFRRDIELVVEKVKGIVLKK